MLILAFLPLVSLLAQSPSCVIEGRVSNLLSGGAVRKAKVLLGTQGNPKYQTITDNEGRYRIPGIAPGKYTLSVQRTGFLPVVYGSHGPNRPGKSLILAAGEDRKEVNFLLEPPGVITGHIYDQDGETLSTAVHLLREVWRDGHKRIEQAGGANADDEGEYRLFGLPAGNYIVATSLTPVRPASPVPTHEVYPTTFYPGTEDVSAAIVLKLAPGGEARDIDLHVRKTVSVQVKGSVVPPPTDPTTRLTLSRRDGVAGLQQVSAMYPQPGEFLTRGVTPGPYVLSARSPTEYARVAVDVGTLDVDGIQLQLVPLLELAGSLKFEGDPPQDPKTFALTLVADDTSEPPSVARSGDDNGLTWKGVTPGKWTLDFTPKLPGLYLKSPQEIEIGPEGHAPIEVVLSTRAARVTGKVQTSAEHPVPVEAATVLLVTDGTKPVRVLKYAITDVDGAYSIAGIPPGKYRLLALEDIETNTWENPVVAGAFEGKGVAIECGAGEKAERDLVLAQP
jgi:Carboxypeptidase regulatory-like domain